MPVPDARVTDLLARLAAIGLTPQHQNRGDHVRIDARIPSGFAVESWPALLAALEGADWFGLADSAARGRHIWAGVATTPPLWNKPPDAAAPASH